MMTPALMEALCWPEQTGAVVVADGQTKARQIPWDDVLADTANRIGPIFAADYLDLARTTEKHRPVRYAYKLAANEYRN